MNKGIYSKEHITLVERLKKARKDAGLNQKQVAKLLDTTQSYVSKIESGQRKVDVIQIKEFARIYKKDINFFLQ
jgi:transcriptional regulator with XRE-family HTH domain